MNHEPTLSQICYSGMDNLPGDLAPDSPAGFANILRLESETQIQSDCCCSFGLGGQITLIIRLADLVENLGQEWLTYLSPCRYYLT